MRIVMLLWKTYALLQIPATGFNSAYPAGASLSFLENSRSRFVFPGRRRASPGITFGATGTPGEGFAPAFKGIPDGREACVLYHDGSRYGISRIQIDGSAGGGFRRVR
jgi:hypothetical protein